MLSIHLREARVFRGSVSLLGPMTWDLYPGENWIVTGDNGSGKSTLLRLLAGEIFPSTGRRIYKIGQEKQLSPLGLKDRLALLSPENQDIYLRQQWDVPCLQVVLARKNTPFFYSSPSEDQQKKARELFGSFGIKNLMRRSFLDLSTGEGRKVLLLQALLSDPDIFFLDEFTSGLDHIFLEEIKEMLMEFISLGKQVVFATHRQEDIPDVRGQELRLDQGKVLRKEKMSVSCTTQRSCFFPAPEATAQPLLTIINSSVVRDEQVVLEDICFCQKKGENWAIVGENGAGKSTFLNLVLGRVCPLPGGQVLRHGRLQGSVLNFHSFVGYVAPVLQARWPGKCNVRDLLASGFYFSEGLFQELDLEQMEQVEETARIFELDTLLERPAYALSYGQKRRALIARALVHSPDLLLLDEPFSGLSGAWREKICSILQKRCNLGLNLLMVTHRPEDMYGLVSHVLILEQGRIKAHGPACELAHLL